MYRETRCGNNNTRNDNNKTVCTDNGRGGRRSV